MAAQEPSPPSSLEGNKPGFPKKILANNLEDKHLCNSCQKILRRPLQAQCGHRFCSFCFNKIVSCGPQKCSACIKEDLFEEPTSILKQGGAFPDNAARREVEALAAVCPNEGCTWTGTVKEFEVEKEKIHDHERQCSYEHLNLLLHFIMGIKVSLESLQPQSLEVASQKLQELHQSLRDLELKMSQLGGCVAAPVQGACAPTLTTSFTPLPSAMGAALELQLQSEKTKVAELSRRCQELELKVSTFENIVCVLNREMERSCTTMEAYNRQHRLDQDKIEILNNKVRQLERTVSLRDLSIVEMEGKMREMSAATYDGIFVWKISDFTKKRQDAVAGRAPAMFSPAFYTSKYGYKMCLRIYLNGDGTGRGTHLSLFFVVMRGHSDALLKWPFNQKVTLMLLDQNNREHIIDAFRPDISSSSFQRPVSDMNIASGCPLFCPLSKLDSKNSYIRDDTIFIKAIVDLTGL
ncbi:TNF receptor-associated factor 2-like isoform X4 [Neolamprologus brichardi]|uniref:TNF receptor-associated factor 2-like isoform X4 n=1 Tax=Neolamprologus brichardi TaxID=32507 RepID=UPI0016437E01|nr:TNF receptor-associated factor 2-like isoform X4 [Neolamprologus brichardi]